MSAHASGLSLLTNSAVERETGLLKDTLRVWERRYGYPKPIRDEAGERLYSLEDVGKLRLIRRLMDQGLGYRPAFRRRFSGRYRQRRDPGARRRNLFGLQGVFALH